MKLLLALLAAASCAAADRDWPTYGGTPAHDRYSPLRQINRTNVNRLKIAWTYDTSDGPGDPQTQPIVVNGVFYGVTPSHKAVALDAATGNLLWTFDSGIRAKGANRGVVYWSEGNQRRVFVGVQSYVYALDPRTGRVVDSFGTAGRIDLRDGLGREASQQSIVLTTPGLVYRDLLIVGGRTPEALPAPPGDIRAYDARTGKQRWAFHTIPRPGEPGYETWPPNAWTYTGAANSWPGLALDRKLGIVYVPTGSAASDFYGADRLGDNLYANCLLALNAATGERIWHFQAVKHDIWDRDFPSPPTLVRVRHEGRMTDGVVQTTKQGFVFLFDRQTGKPLFPLEYRTYPASNVPGEEAATRQPLPLKPLPFARQLLTEELLSNRTPEVHEWALNQFRTFRSAGQFLPFAVDKETVIMPGFDGGAEWGGSAFDPETGLLYVNANDVAWTSSLTENHAGGSARQIYLSRCASCHGDGLKGAPPSVPSLLDLRGARTAQQVSAVIAKGAGRMPSFPSLSAAETDSVAAYVLGGESNELQSLAEPVNAPRYRFTGYRRFLDPEGYPAVAPPWGTLNAIDLNTGEYAWKVPLGEYPQLAARGMKDTGSENYGGPVVTAGGLVFIAATNFDRKFRAFDKSSGKLLWEAVLPFAGNSTPITYMKGDKQYVVIYATGGKSGSGDRSGGVFVAFALP